MKRLDQMVTEARNPNTTNIDQLTSIEIIHLINDEDKKVALAVEQELESIAQAVDLITHALQDLSERELCAQDIVVGIAASGRTPYVLGALKAAKAIGAKIIAISCNPGSPIAIAADIAITPVVGPEVIMGSTRLKAGTAQKMVLNMLSTASMIRLGKVYSNLMVDLCATNQKLIERAKRIVVLATGCSEDIAAQAIAACHGKVKQAIVMIMAEVTPEQAEQLLVECDGFVRLALENAALRH